jgi:hypothetical protein
LINNTDDGDTYQYADDYDEDGIEDNFDNCPFAVNKAQLDSDGDGIGDVCDTCAQVSNKDQLDTDSDGTGDACDDDIDNDGLANAKDNCPTVSNNFNNVQIDTDKDGKGDACDTDDDNDGVLDINDNCPLVKNPQQLNSDPNSFGDACDNDTDLDNIDDTKDNCPMVLNPDQQDGDKDKIGDACDTDLDNDGILNLNDNCPNLANKDQSDVDRDGKGDTCDSRYCFVVYGDEKNCLDPKSPFTVYSPTMRVQTGEEARLRLFANRKNEAIRYTWIVVKRPGQSTATVTNPKGTVRASTPYEYHYIKGNTATFSPDEPGEYQLKVDANLVFADSVNSNWNTDHTYTMTIVAEGDSVGGCSMGTTQPGAVGFVMASLLLGLGLAFRRRRK